MRLLSVPALLGVAFLFVGVSPIIAHFQDTASSNNNSLQAAASFATGCAQTNLAYCEDFQDSAWTGTTSGLWRIASNCFGGDPAPSLQYNTNTACNFDVGTTSGAATVQINLASATAPKLNFVTKCSTEGGTHWDEKSVQASADGSSYTTVLQLVYLGSGAQRCDTASWLAKSVSLSSYAGDSTVWLRFWFNSKDNIANSGMGWAVDKIEVTKT